MEIVMIVAAVVAMYRIAETENESGMVWGGLTLAASIAAVVAIPLPLLRILIVLIVMFVGMTAYRMVARK